MTDKTPTIHRGFEDGAPTPLGFSFGGDRCGIKQSRLDLGAIVSDRDAVAAGCFTRNEVKAACVVRNAAMLPKDGIRGLVVNSGNANAMTGPQGDAANETMARALGAALGVPPSSILTASTGGIGRPLPADLIETAIPALVQGAAADPRPFATAILTTDSTTKLAHTEVHVGGTSFRVLGVAKGSGMIHPNMATTLSYVCTDAKVAPTALAQMLPEIVDETFNSITVDGDTSTNDMVVVLANGASDLHIEGEALVSAFRAALLGVVGDLARQVAADGEGATRLLEVEVSGAPDRATARTIARGICSSNLIKCSVFAGQPEWGRVASATGQVAAGLGLTLDERKLKIAAQGIVLYDGGQVYPKNLELRRVMQSEVIRWTVDLGLGTASGTAFGCDLTYDYVRINSDESKQVDSSRTGAAQRSLTLAAYSPRLKHQLLCEGLAYVRRFTGLKIMVYLQPSEIQFDPIPSLARDLELCVDAGLKPLAVVPDPRSVDVIQDHMKRAGHFCAAVPPDPVAINGYLDRGHLTVLVRETRAPDLIVDLALKIGIQKLIVIGNDQGLRDGQGVVQRLSPDTLLAGLERGRFDASDPDLLVLARHAALRGIPALHIVDARVPHSVVGELFTDEGVGTLMTRQA